MVTIIPVKVLNQNGSGWSSVVARGIIYVADLKDGPLANYPVIINMSLGGDELDAMEKAAIDYAIAHGWILRRAGARAHAWGRLYCPRHDREGCQQAVYCTPRDPEPHARDIRRAVDSCPHQPDEGQE